MDAVKIMATAIVIIMLALLLKEQKPYMATALVIVGALYIFFLVLPYLDRIASYIRVLYSETGEKDFYMNTVLKITAISIIASLTSNLCKDSGMSAVASVVTLSAKAICMCMTLPVMADFFENLLLVLP